MAPVALAMSNYKVDNSHHARRGGQPAAKRQAIVTEVWHHNLEDEMCNLRDCAEVYPHVAIEVLVPKVVASPTGPFGEYLEYNYQMMRCNVDLNRALQISLTLADAKGNRPKGVSGTWRFNFDYNPNKDFFLQETLDQLCDLSKHQSQGIGSANFGELMMGSGLVLSDDVKWIAFTGDSGLSEPSKPRTGLYSHASEPPERRFCGLYGYSYLLQLLMCQELPETVEGFREVMDLFFPSRCDLADHIHQLPHMSSTDPTDPLKRPLFCSGHHCLEGFFRLPEAVRRTAFDSRVVLEVPPVAAGNASRRRPNRRRHKGEREEPNGTGTNGNYINNGHGNEVGNGYAK